MATKNFSLVFGGYWLEANVDCLPDRSGIYGVYACIYDSAKNTVSLKRLLYIGEAANVQNRVTCHDQWKNWKKQLKLGEVICVCAAEISPEADRQRAEAAMIFKHKPPCNTEYVDYFPFDATTITTSGANALMVGSFTVNRVEKAAYSGSRWL